jgi:hypothetical protein
MKPDSSLVLSEDDVRGLTENISRKIEELKEHYTHLERYNSRNAISSPSLIWYRHNIRYEPNPDLDRDTEKNEQSPVRKRHLVLEELPVYSEEDSIDLRIHFTRYDDLRQSARVWIPDLWIGDHAVEISIKGARTREINEIRNRVKEILVNVKKEAEK